MSSDSVSVIVVCANAKVHLPICLDSLKSQSHINTEVIVVDNGSVDGTREYVESSYPWVRIHSTGKNLGYAAANNVGFLMAVGDLLVVLNPDTEVDRDFVAALRDAICESGAGLATSRICHFDRRDVVNACGNEIHLTGIGYCRGLGEPAKDFDNGARVASVSGCAFMIRRDVLERLGGFDEDYFMYVEDTDLSMRANIAGYDIVYVPRSRVFHKYALNMSPRKFQLLERNRRQALLTNLRWGTLAAMLPAIWVTGGLMWLYAVIRGPEYFAANVRAHLWIYRNWRLLMRKRRRVQALRVENDHEIVSLLSTTLPVDQVVGTSSLAQVLGFLMNGLFRLVAIPVRVFV